MDKEYLVTKSYLEQKVLDLAIDLRSMEQQMDDTYKINMYLIRRFKDELVKEFNIQPPNEIPEYAKALQTIFPGANAVVNMDEFTNYYTLMAVINKIKDIMKEEMPDPWYCYGFGQKYVQQ